MNKREYRTACTRQPRAVPDRHARYQTEKVGTTLPVEFSCLRYENNHSGRFCVYFETRMKALAPWLTLFIRIKHLPKDNHIWKCLFFILSFVQVSSITNINIEQWFILHGKLGSIVYFYYRINECKIQQLWFSCIFEQENKKNQKSNGRTKEYSRFKVKKHNWFRKEYCLCKSTWNKTLCPEEYVFYGHA